jgi:hypothetical protein
MLHYDSPGRTRIVIVSSTMNLVVTFEKISNMAKLVPFIQFLSLKCPTDTLGASGKGYVPNDEDQLFESRECRHTMDNHFPGR